MADSKNEAATSAEKAYAAAAAEVKPATQAKPEAKPAEAAAPSVSKAEVKAEKPTPSKTRAQESIKKTAPKRLSPNAKAKAAKRAARVAKASVAPKAAVKIEPKLTVSELKEKIMATAQKTIGTTDFTQPIAEAFGEFQNKAKAAYEKSTEVATEVTDFAKGNVEAMVESSKILAAGAQTLGKSYVEEAKSAYETATADVKELAAVKSPAELFQLQGKIFRRNFDAFVATSSKNAEAMMKLTNDAFAPLTGRVNVAAEKLSKVA